MQTGNVVFQGSEFAALQTISAYYATAIVYVMVLEIYACGFAVFCAERAIAALLCVNAYFQK